MEFCNVRGFVADGIHIEGFAQGTPPTNANGWVLYNCRVVNCGGDGLHATGPDANQGECYGLDVAACLGWGIDDESFLGNQYYSPQVATCGLGSYRTTNQNARTVLYSPYAESNQPAAQLKSKTLVIGGILAVTADSTHAAFYCDYTGPVQLTSGGGYATVKINGAGSLEGYSHGPPPDGYHRRGERLYAINPSAGGVMGWVCVVSGTPGTWKTFGVIGA
jgi:hypothetical protein